MTSNLIVYLIAIPLFSSAVLLLAGRKANKWGHLLGTLASAISFGIGAYFVSLVFGKGQKNRRPTQERINWSNPVRLKLQFLPFAILVEVDISSSILVDFLIYNSG